jgi:hypothetical protein
MKTAILVIVSGMVGAANADVVIYTQAPVSPATLTQSSEVIPDGSDSDVVAWDSFILSSGGSVTEVAWRGGYIYNAPYGRVTEFSVAFHASTAMNTEPYVLAHLQRHRFTGNAGETFAGNFNGINIYEYRVVLPRAFQAEPGVKYWVKIVGGQPTYPDWALQKGAGNGSHFKYLHGLNRYSFYPGDCAFTLYGPVPCYADCDPSTGQRVLDIFDFLCFQNRYSQNDPYACDCDMSTGAGVCDIFDFLCFQNTFAAGCP